MNHLPNHNDFPKAVRKYEFLHPYKTPLETPGPGLVLPLGKPRVGTFGKAKKGNLFQIIDTPGIPFQFIKENSGRVI